MGSMYEICGSADISKKMFRYLTFNYSGGKLRPTSTKLDTAKVSIFSATCMKSNLESRLFNRSVKISRLFACMFGADVGHRKFLKYR